MKGIERYKLLVLKERIHKDVKFSIENIISNIISTLYGDNSNYAYRGEYLLMFIIVKTLYYTTEILCQPYFN